MTRRCELTGKLPLSGQNRSHAENKTKRKFRPNLCNVTMMSERLGRKMRLRVCAQAIRTVEHVGGLDEYLAKTSREALSLPLRRLKAELAKTAAATSTAPSA
jgi:large subunit ribosomal protein L28